MMNKEEIIYPSMVIRIQSEAIKLLKKQNKDLQQRINEAKDVVKEIKLHYQQHPTMIPSVKIDRLDEILGGKE